MKKGASAPFFCRKLVIPAFAGMTELCGMTEFFGTTGG
jgi:hypothetical protein